MTERLLQFIWQLQYFNKQHLQTTTGEPIQVLHPGQLNTNQGPDFLQARIRLADTTWVGNIELHTRSSLWNVHRHHEDSNYTNVILHVVWEDDATVHNAWNIPVLSLQDKTPKLLLRKYEELMHNTAFIPCEKSLRGVPDLVWISWKERLAVERLERKVMTIRKHLSETKNHWEEVFWWMLARNFGIHVNSDTFEAIARSVSIRILARHKKQIHQLESILFGQAGLLYKPFAENYPNMLRREYDFLRKKYRLQPVSYPLHYLRMRPRNFPTIRLAQLAQLIYQSSHLFSKIKDAGKLSALQQLLQVTANDYWHYHYRFDETSSYVEKTLGKQMINNIVINTIVPVVFAYGYVMSESCYIEKALQWLEETPAETNTLTRKWVRIGICNRSALDSQALTELTRAYCFCKNCLSCAVGNAILKGHK